MRQFTVSELDRNDYRQRSMLNALLDSVYGFTFEQWYASGKWDDRYRPYGIIDGDRILANASVTVMDLLVEGRPIQAIQIGTVATLPECRGQGLARQVMEHILARYAGLPAFLFAHQGVLDFYPRFGFRRAEEAQPSLRLTRPTAGSGCVRLTPDSPVVARHLGGQRQLSALLDVANASSINWFHILMEFADDIYHIPTADALVIARQNGSKAILLGVFCSGELPVETLIDHLPFVGIETVEFTFTPDRLCREYQARPYDAVAADSYLFVRGLEFPAGARFPHLAMT